MGGVGLQFVGLFATGRRREGRSENASDRRSCITLVGGPSHQDTFDLKPDGPSEYRGEFKPIKTNVPGMEICEHMPKLAKCADKYTIVRGVSHTLGSHFLGTDYLNTGNRPLPSLDFPSYGTGDQSRDGRLSGIFRPLWRFPIRPKGRVISAFNTPPANGRDAGSWPAFWSAWHIAGQRSDDRRIGTPPSPTGRTRHSVQRLRTHERRSFRFRQVRPASLRHHQLAKSPQGVRHEPRADQGRSRVWQSSVRAKLPAGRATGGGRQCGSLR